MVRDGRRDGSRNTARRNPLADSSQISRSMGWRSCCKARFPASGRGSAPRSCGTRKSTCCATRTTSSSPELPVNSWKTRFVPSSKASCMSALWSTLPRSRRSRTCGKASTSADKPCGNLARSPKFNARRASRSTSAFGFITPPGAPPLPWPSPARHLRTFP